MVSEQDRLGALQVGVAGHQRSVILFRQVQEGLLNAAQAGQSFVDDFPSIETDVEGNLVVAGAAGVESSAGGADKLGQPPFNVHMQVFEGGVPRKIAGFNFGLDSVQAVDDGGGVSVRDDALAGQHPGVDDGAGDVLPVEAAVVVDGYGVVGVVGHGWKVGSGQDGDGVSV